jgi:DNA-binding Lrp family transcriptional regulator
MSGAFDNLDLNILKILQRNGRVSITELAEKIGVSRPTITSRLSNLFKDDTVIVRGGLNIAKLDFKMASIGLEVRNEEARVRMEEMTERCPKILVVYRSHEKANLHLVIWGEDERAVKSTIESYGDLPHVNIVYSHYLGTPTQGYVMRPVHTGEEENTPCGKNCTVCNRYTKGWCRGCPKTKHYTNVFTEKKLE